MRIGTVKIQNYRSIRFAEISPTSFNLFVGQNNHGKTNFFEALEWFFTGPRKAEEADQLKNVAARQDEMYVEIEFVDFHSAIAQMKNEKNKKVLEGLIKDHPKIVLRRSSQDPKKRVFVKNGVPEEKNPTGFDPALNDFLPKFEFIETKVKLQDIAAYKSTSPIGSMLTSVLTALLETNQEYKDFRNTFNNLFKSESSEIKVKLDSLSGKVKLFLEKQFPDCVRVTFEIGQPAFDDLLKNFDTLVDDGVETNSVDKGDGMQRALMLAIIQTYAEHRREHREEFKDKSFIFLFDEGELHLHPTAQRKLKKALLDISNQGDQVFLNTHSSVLIADEDSSQTIFQIEKIEGATEITKVEDAQKAYVVYDLLGGSPTDLLLPCNFLIVEGRSEFEFLKTIVSRFYQDRPKIQIVFAEGDHEKQRKSMDGINDIFNPLHLSPLYKSKVVLLCDKPSIQKEADFNKFKDAYFKEDDHRLKILDVENIEESYPCAYKKSKQELVSISKVKYAKEVSGKMTQDEFETSMPIVFGALQKCWELAYQ